MSIQEEPIMNGNSGYHSNGTSSIPDNLKETLSSDASALPEPHPLQGTSLIALADYIELFHTADGEACIAVRLGTMAQAWPLRSKELRRWLRWRFFHQFQAVPSASKLKDMIELLTGIALFEGAEHQLYTRIAEHAGAIYIDLANDQGAAVEVTAEGWRTVAVPPVRFYRPTGMIALPTP
jgi:hypothetical protein